MIREFFKKSKNGIVAAKSAIDEGFTCNLIEGLEIEKKYYKTIVNTHDRIEGLNAFIEKREPIYKNK